MAPTLYHVPKTISSPLVQALVELSLVDKPVQVKEITFVQLKSPEYLAINPMGTSPAFMDGDIILWESGAVLSYLLERYDTQHQLHPPCLDPNASEEQLKTRAKYLQLKQYNIATVYPFVASLFVHTLKPLQEQDADYVISAKNKWTTLLGPILTKWLGDGPYFLGSELSVIDLLVAKPLNNINALGLLVDFPSLQRLFESVKSRPSFRLAYEGMPTTNQDDVNKNIKQERSLLLVPKKENSDDP